MLLLLLLYCIAAFLGAAMLGIVASRQRSMTPALYAATLLISVVAAAVALTQLLGGGDVPATILPLGLPWIGARFRLDGLAALFVAVINLGGAAASLYAIGYGRHEPSPQRVLPFFPAFLAGMNLVLLADDAFTFLLSWELMSVASWA